MNMNDVLQILRDRFSLEPFARTLGIKIAELEPGHATVTMRTTNEMNNLFATTHGGAIYSLLDAAFELTVNSHGTVAVALQVNVNYLSAALPGEMLTAEGREVNRSRKISACEIRVTGEDGRLIATSQTLAFRKKDPLPFLV
ncbi:MAG: hotdog fold thioesterase [Methanothrix sp.]|nr:MAG: hotdog fold thioesterase [Methanothrix sp.]